MLIRVLLLVTMTATFFLMNLGGYVHNTAASLACPDWPLCFGQLMPEMSGGVLFEHSHRLLASFVGVCTVILFLLTRRSAYRRMSLVALVLVIIQASLGGLTVIYKLPPMVSTAHLGVAMIFFCCLISLYQNQLGNAFHPSRELGPITIGVFAQILLGAFLRHHGAGAACGVGEENIFFCSGRILPVSVNEGLHLFHRLLGITLGTMIVVKACLVMRSGRSLFGHFLSGLVLLQFWIGTKVISSGFMPFVTTLHLGVATLLLGTLWNEQFTGKNPAKLDPDHLPVFAPR